MMRKLLSLTVGALTMKILIGSLVVVLAGLVVVACQSPATAEKIGLDFWNAGDLEKQIRHGERRQSEMDRNIESVAGRLKARQQILESLMAEKTTLEQAGRDFLELNLTNDYTVELLRGRDPDGTDLERAICQVVRQMMTIQTAESERCVSRLKNELRVTRPKVAVWAERLVP
jgi:hypothetical protein